MTVKLKPLSQQVIVITGASSGIGLATAYRAAERGAKVVLVARNARALAAIEQRIRKGGGQAIHVVADVSRRADLDRVAAAAIKAFGGFDTWVNNAGVGVFGRLADVSDADHRQVFEVNFWGVVYGSTIAAEHLKQSGGAIINMGSVVGDAAFSLQGMYGASKHAIKGFTDAFRMELEEARSPISITLIKPSAMDTPFPEHARNYLDQEPKLPPPLYRPEQVADTVLHAAEHGGRDYIVGGVGVAISAINKVFPRVLDWAGARLVPGLSSSGPPVRPPAGNLFQAGRDGDVRGNGSIAGGGALRPVAALALLAVAGLAGTSFLGRKRA